MNKQSSLDKELNTLYAKLEKIGFRVTYIKVNKKEPETEDIDIEETLCEALFYIDHEGRLFSLIISWLNVHGRHVIFDKLLKAYKSECKRRKLTSPWFSAICSYMFVVHKDHRFVKHMEKIKGGHSFGNREQSELIALKGAVEWLEIVDIQMAKSSLRVRDSDIEAVDTLISKNLQYRNRFIFGTNWRAEVITQIQRKKETTPSGIARKLGISKSRVGEIFKDYFRAVGTSFIAERR